MDKSPVISIVVPVYGAEPYIAEFAESVLGQSYPHLQFIFVNDGTKDKSIEVLNALVDGKYPHLRSKMTIVQKENGGVHTARKAGMEHVVGDYVYHADPDDLVAPGSMEKIARVAKTTDADVIYFHHVKEYANRSKVKREALYSADTKEEYVRAMFNHRAYGALWNKCVKAQSIGIMLFITRNSPMRMTVTSPCSLWGMQKILSAWMRLYTITARTTLLQ